jgi:hypothetical protein
MMKYKWVVAALCMSGMAMAQADDAIKDSNRQVRLSVGGRTVEYHEYDPTGQANGNWFDSEDGTLPGLSVSYVAQGDAIGVSDLYFSAAFTYGRGKTNYDGYLQSNGNLVAPYQTSTRTTMTDVDVKLGKGFRFADGKAQLTPYLGYSSHEWKRGSSRDMYWVKESYEYQAASLGLLAQYAFTSRLVASAEGSYGRTLSPRMTIEGGPTLELQSKPITMLGFGMDYKLSGNWRLHAAYSMKKFQYGESSYKYWGQNSSGQSVYVMEPTSKSTFNDFYAGIGYSF